jgi:proteic killer suppression protein
VEIRFASDQLARLCNDSKSLRRKYGAEGEKLIRRRLDELRDAATLAVVAKLPAPRCEELKGDRAGQLSVRVHGGFRLVFQPDHDPVPRKPDGGLDWAAVSVIQIRDIENYHG